MFPKPTLIINKSKVEDNLARMHQKAVQNSVGIRPHFKTHQSAEIGELFREKGVDKITVSSVSMAEYFANHGWKDITIAFPVNLREVTKIDNLAGNISLNLLVDSSYSTEQLAGSLTNQVGLFVEIDNGYHRSGLLPEQIMEIEKIVQITEQSDQLLFKGFLTHAGNTYNAKSKAEILSIMADAAEKLNDLKAKFIDRFPNIITSYGDTPSCSMAEDLSLFNEIRPGNFVYYDVMQYHIGSCTLDDIAVAVACPIVSVYPDRSEMVIYGGAVHFSKEFIAADNNFQLFGYVVELKDTGWSEPIPGAYVSSISQEHGVVKMPKDIKKNYKPGDVLGVLPVHSCLTADLLRETQIIFD